jgi:hypothetical protein
MYFARGGAADDLSERRRAFNRIAKTTMGQAQAEERSMTAEE